jgi:hypothetical protein
VIIVFTDIGMRDHKSLETIGLENSKPSSEEYLEQKNLKSTSLYRLLFKIKKIIN